MREPAVRFHTSPWRRGVLRELYGTPVDHPSLEQLAAEVEHWDERREDRRREYQERLGLPHGLHRTA